MARVADLIRARSGLTFPDIRVRDVEATVQRVMKSHALDSFPQVLQLLEEDAAARDALVADLTIGETYFQRDTGQFDLLRTRLLPELLERVHDRPLRIWSAGCASGEEPYSIAMLLEELGAAGRAQIIGTDIARPRLTDAQRAIYSKWSLRGMPDPMVERYFRQRGRFFELHSRLRQQVDFRYLNLAEDRFPSLAAGIWGMDLILCRNVLIYFDRPTVDRVARRLVASLSEEGWLLLGASDPSLAERVHCTTVLTGAGVVYRRPSAPGGANAAGGWYATAPVPPPAPTPDRESSAPPLDNGGAPPPTWDAAPPPAAAAGRGAEEDPTAGGDMGPDPVPSPRPPAEPAAAASLEERVAEAYGRRDFDAVIQVLEAVPASALSEHAWVCWLRALANQGCMEEAGLVAARALESHGPTAELLYLHAVLLLHSGRAADAAAAARRALYLDRTLIVAHLTLADALRRTGSVEASRRSLRNAAALLASLDRDAPVAASDGDTAGRLAELVNVKLRLLDEAA